MRKKLPKKRKPRILVFDIEIAGQFGANAGYILCIGYRWVGERKTHLLSIRDNAKAFAKNCTNDKDLVQRFSKIAAQADMWVTWYGSRFDVPFIQTRRLIHGLKPLPQIAHWDGWRVARFDLKFTRNSLDTVSRSLPLSTGEVREFKTPLDFTHWIQAGAGQLKSLRYVEKHCIADIAVTDGAFLKMRPFTKTMPNLTLLSGEPFMGCASCGSFDTVKNGIKACAQTTKQQHLCRKCGHYFYTSLSKRVGRNG